jgi:hypothetical protein
MTALAKLILSCLTGAAAAISPAHGGVVLDGLQG